MTDGMREIGGGTIGVKYITQKIPPRHLEIGGATEIGRWRATGLGAMGRRGIMMEM